MNETTRYPLCWPAHDAPGTDPGASVGVDDELVARESVAL